MAVKLKRNPLTIKQLTALDKRGELKRGSSDKKRLLAYEQEKLKTKSALKAAYEKSKGKPLSLTALAKLDKEKLLPKNSAEHKRLLQLESAQIKTTQDNARKVITRYDGSKSILIKASSKKDALNKISQERKRLGNKIWTIQLGFRVDDVKLELSKYANEIDSNEDSKYKSISGSPTLWDRKDKLKEAEERLARRGAYPKKGGDWYVRVMLKGE
jgi:hypothetical protein